MKRIHQAAPAVFAAWACLLICVSVSLQGCAIHLAAGGAYTLALVSCGAGVLVAFGALHHGWLHRFRLPTDYKIQWRRRYDKVLMSALRCPHCGRVHHISCNPTSYEHMQSRWGGNRL